MDVRTRVGLYARVSTQGQDHTNQVERLKEWATRQGFDVAIIESDKASGRRVVRPGQERIMAEARGHHIHAVAVVKVDRWARSVQHLSTTLHELHDLGVAFYATDQGLTIRKGDATSKMMFDLLGAVAEWEASIISERTRDGLVGKVGKGRHPNGCGVDFPCPSGVHDETGEAKAPPAGA